MGFADLLGRQFDSMQDKKGFRTDGLDIQYPYEQSTALGGYFILIFSKLPDMLLELLNLSGQYLNNQVLTPNVISVELPTYSITATEVQHGYGLRTMLPLELANSTNFSINFYENQMGDIANVFTNWQRIIMDETLGIPLPTFLGKEDDKYFNYKTDATLVILPPYIPEDTTSEDYLSTCPLAIKFMNIWPTTVPLSTYGADIQSNEIITLSVSFTFDRFRIFTPVYDTGNWNSLYNVYDLISNFYTEDSAWFYYGVAESTFAGLYALFGKYIV